MVLKHHFMTLNYFILLSLLNKLTSGYSSSFSLLFLFFSLSLYSLFFLSVFLFSFSFFPFFFFFSLLSLFFFFFFFFFLSFPFSFPPLPSLPTKRHPCLRAPLPCSVTISDPGSFIHSFVPELVGQFFMSNFRTVLNHCTCNDDFWKPVFRLLDFHSKGKRLTKSIKIFLSHEQLNQESTDEFPRQVSSDASKWAI